MANKKKKLRSSLFSKFLLILFCIGCLLATFVGIAFEGIVSDRPEITSDTLLNNEQISIVYDMNGKEIATLAGEEKRINVEYDEIPAKLVEAFISIEDKRFWQHDGVDANGLVNAVLGELKGGGGRGGSTITQQLIKNKFLSSERSYKRKAKEIVMAYELESILEKQYGKEEAKKKIFTYYVNEVFFGEDNYGIRAAALDYFGKDLNELTLKEAAGIAGMTQSPNSYNPRQHYSDFNDRADLVLYEMMNNGYITEEEYRKGCDEKPVITEKYFSNATYPYASFIDFAIDEIAKDMLEIEGTEITEETVTAKTNAIRTGGYKIYLTIDTEHQDAMQQIAAEYPYATEGIQPSAVVIDHHTGEIRVMIPGREENTVMKGFNRAVDSLQAIGSTAKPIFVYAPYIELGANTDTIVDDTKTPIDGWKTAQGYPDGVTTDKKITVRYAIETSRNIAAAKTLANEVKIPTSYQYQIAEGINPEHSSQSLSGIALGADGYTVLETAGAYATLANDGVYITPHAYTMVTDMDGNKLLDANDSIVSRRVFSSETAFMMTDMLHTTMTNGYGKNANLPNITSAGKTGTHEHEVVTMAGYTHYYTCFLRLNMDDYSEIKDVSMTHAAGLWKQLMSNIHEGLPDAPIQDKTFDELNLIMVGNELRHRGPNDTEKYYPAEPVFTQEYTDEFGNQIRCTDDWSCIACDEWGNCWWQ